MLLPFCRSGWEFTHTESRRHRPFIGFTQGNAWIEDTGRPSVFPWSKLTHLATGEMLWSSLRGLAAQTLEFQWLLHLEKQNQEKTRKSTDLPSNHWGDLFPTCSVKVMALPLLSNWLISLSLRGGTICRVGIEAETFLVTASFPFLEMGIRS